MLEKTIENTLRTEVKRLGGLCLKFVSPGRDSVPDRIVLYRGQAWFIEVKRLGQKPTLKQVLLHEEFKRHGFEVKIINSIENVKNFINELRTV